MSLNAGDLVKVRVFGGQVVIRRLLRVEGQIAVLTVPEEPDRALKERREPVCIGFPLRDVIQGKRASPPRER